MCDFSLEAFRSRPAKVGDRLAIRQFATGTTGFADPDDLNCAVCLKPGTEIAFDAPLRTIVEQTNYTVAKFIQVDLDRRQTHHDALEFADGEVFKLQALTHYTTIQWATVLQMPVEPKVEPKSLALLEVLDRESEPVPEVA